MQPDQPTTFAACGGHQPPAVDHDPPAPLRPEAPTNGSRLSEAPHSLVDAADKYHKLA
jgi:hypothetical protein